MILYTQIGDTMMVKCQLNFAYKIHELKYDKDMWRCYYGNKKSLASGRIYLLGKKL